MSSFVETKIEDMLSDQPNFSLSSEEYQLLLGRLELEAKSEREEARKQAHARAWKLARQQGVKPIRSMAELQADFWPEEESIDEFLSWLHDLRQNDRLRSIPE